MEKQNLIPLVERVAELRRVCKIMDAKELELIDKVKVLPESVALEALQYNMIELSHKLGLAQEELKSAALAIHEETGEKKPIEKVEVKIFQRLKYDLAEATAWCRINASSLLILNKKPFEKTAAVIGAPVEVTEEAKCTIGTDLSSYIKTKEEVKTDG